MFVHYVTCTFAHTELLDFMCRQMATIKHGDLDCRLSTAINYLFRELVFQKRAGLWFSANKNIYLTELTLKEIER